MNKKLKETLKHLFATQKINNGWTSFSEKECKELSNYINDLEKRIEKAVEYIKFEWGKILNNENYKNHMWTVDGLVIKTIIDTLNGRSDE